MASITVVFLLSVLVIVAAQPKLSDIPQGCSTTPANPEGCLFASPIPYFGACGVYDSGACWTFCNELMNKPKTCVTNQPARYMAFRLKLRCVLKCVEARRNITRFVNEGKKRSMLHSLIYVGLDDKGNINAKNYVYEFSTTKITHTTCPPTVLCFDSNKCVCSVCWSNRAACPRCCCWAGHIYV